MSPKKNRIVVELETDDDTVHKLYQVMSSNNTLSSFLERLVTLRLNNFEANANNDNSSSNVGQEVGAELTYDNSVLNLLYDLKETVEELKENIDTQSKSGIDLTGIEGVMKSVISSSNLSQPVVHYVDSSKTGITPIASNEQLNSDVSKSVNLSYLDEEIGEVIKTNNFSSSEGTTADVDGVSKPPAKKSLKNMNMSKLKKMKGG